MRRLAIVVLVALLATILLAQDKPAANNEDQPPASANQASASQPDEEQPATVVVTAGTKVPLALKHAISTKSAKPGDPVYLESTFPVVQNNRVLIPAGTYVQGVITSVTRPGRVKGKAQLLMHFDTLIFPNGYTVSLPGALDSVPGAENTHIKDKEGTVERNSEKGKDAATIAGTTATGTLAGVAAGGTKGLPIGAGAGAATGLLITMLTRGSDVRFEMGTVVEMVLQRPLVLEEARLTDSPRPLVPAKTQDRKLRPVLNPPPDRP